MDLNEAILAIDIISKARSTHTAWADFLENNPNVIKEPQYANIGNVEHHKKYIEDYGIVIECIRKCFSEKCKLKTQLDQQAKNAMNQIEILTTELDQHRWIPVEERLPELHEPCLVYDNENIYVAERHKYTNSEKVGWYGANITWKVEENITHWKPIELPQAGKEE